ncbi:MAG: type II toxin-antitoxin system CcdA family antitoxin [Betaproteobacteria bacterium]|nr:type II toxin-antitoxin system CcdA family antitoxin [Betaproteobacteria bacterium]
MKASENSPQKRPVDLLLSDKTVRQARELTNNLSATVEQLLSEFVVQHRDDVLARQRADDSVAEFWNRFEEIHGSFADEHQVL